VAAQPKVLKKHSVVLAWLQSEANERCARAGRDNFAGGPWHFFQDFGFCTRRPGEVMMIPVKSEWVSSARPALKEPQGVVLDRLTVTPAIPK